MNWKEKKIGDCIELIYVKVFQKDKEEKEKFPFLALMAL